MGPPGLWWDSLTAPGVQHLLRVCRAVPGFLRGGATSESVVKQREDVGYILSGDVEEALCQLHAGTGCLVLRSSGGRKNQGRSVGRSQSPGRFQVTVCGAILDFTRFVR